MQIILVSRHLKAARTITIMPRHLMIAGFVFLALVVGSSATLSWLSGQLGAFGKRDDALSQHAASQQYVSNNLQLMATRLGALQAQVLHLDSLGERLAGLAGVKREAPARDKPAGQGGAFVPAPLTAGELQREIDRLALEVDVRTDELAVLESRFLEQRVKERLLPTTLPVKEAFLGSPFGQRSDPIAGLRAMHEGIDFNAETGTPVVAASDGVVLTAAYRSDFGNMIEVDHGAGLTTRYAHLSRMDVKPGALVKRGEALGAVGSTGRSTGPHLHFEVRMLGVAQNPAQFLKQGEEYAFVKRR
ncbi:M23 family metallopeptidase [Dechloromonas sp. H13]|uniref:M23 family metallopeptidase n=1 Tax=Dechloromonas sp. H13 TaxID=2570193 RepID=UPI001D1838BE|nr:M23 family metallopeptidase [Dechloromonas sp. H13]